MNWLDLTLANPAENLAMDEALLDLGEGGGSGEILRFWESDSYFVVLGYSNKVAEEVNLSSCRSSGIPLFRRKSGGGTVLQGPGCLNYALILDAGHRPELSGITQANRIIMETNRQCLETLLKQPVHVRGHTDLALRDLKFSGNAQRRRKRFFLFHGTFLLDFDFSKIASVLAHPSREPDYRAGRPHRSFLTNISVPREALKQALRKAWQTGACLETLPLSPLKKLVPEYEDPSWIEKF